ncbi:MAG: hypothetical protein MZW92_11460 [Comamonadaceae bacterium]|nr:hypothetical protein [Comamonadaceae bacterium]
MQAGMLDIDQHATKSAMARDGTARASRTCRSSLYARDFEFPLGDQRRSRRCLTPTLRRQLSQPGVEPDAAHTTGTSRPTTDATIAPRYHVAPRPAAAAASSATWSRPSSGTARGRISCPTTACSAASRCDLTSLQHEQAAALRPVPAGWNCNGVSDDTLLRRLRARNIVVATPDRSCRRQGYASYTQAAGGTPRWRVTRATRRCRTRRAAGDQALRAHAAAADHRQRATRPGAGFDAAAERRVRRDFEPSRRWTTASALRGLSRGRPIRWQAPGWFFVHAEGRRALHALRTRAADLAAAPDEHQRTPADRHRSTPAWCSSARPTGSASAVTQTLEPRLYYALRAVTASRARSRCSTRRRPTSTSRSCSARTASSGGDRIADANQITDRGARQRAARPGQRRRAPARRDRPALLLLATQTGDAAVRQPGATERSRRTCSLRCRAASVAAAVLRRTWRCSTTPTTRSPSCFVPR